MKELYEKLGQIQFQIDDMTRMKDDVVMQIRIEGIRLQTQSEVTNVTEAQAE